MSPAVARVPPADGVSRLADSIRSWTSYVVTGAVRAIQAQHIESINCDREGGTRRCVHLSSLMDSFIRLCVTPVLQAASIEFRKREMLTINDISRFSFTKLGQICVETPEEGITQASLQQPYEMIHTIEESEVLEDGQRKQHIDVQAPLIKMGGEEQLVAIQLLQVEPRDKQAHFGVAVDRINHRSAWRDHERVSHSRAQLHEGRVRLLTSIDQQRSYRLEELRSTANDSTDNQYGYHGILAIHLSCHLHSSLNVQYLTDGRDWSSHHLNGHCPAVYGVYTIEGAIEDQVPGEGAQKNVLTIAEWFQRQIAQ